MAASDPWAKHIAPDWSTAPLGDVASSAVHNFGPSLKRDARQAVQPVIDLFHPSTWPGYANTAKQLAVGIGDKTAGWLGADQDPKKKAADEAAINAVWHYFAQRYGSVPALKQTLATDPAGALFDTSAALSIPAGGEGLVARVPGIVGKASQIATRAARIGAEVTNPVGVAGRIASGSAKVAINAAHGALTDRVGNLAPSVQATIQKAFPSGIIGPTEMADPQFKAAVLANIQRSGNTPAAIKQAVLDYHDVQAPRSVVSGKAPPPGARGVAQQLVDTGRQKLGETATSLSGAPAPSPTQLGQSLEDAQIAAHNGMHSLYKQAFAHPGEYDPASLEGLPETIGSKLAADHLPATSEELEDFPSYVQTRAAYEWLPQKLAKLGASNDLTMPNLERVRQELNQYRFKADGTDSRGVSAIIDGFDQHLQDAAASGLFSGSPQAANDMAQARRAFKDYQETFNNHKNPARSSIFQAVKNFKDQAVDPDTGLISAPSPPGSAEAAQGALERKLINPRTLDVPAGADKLYGHLTDALGGEGSPGHQALNDYIRQTALATGDNGLVANSTRLRSFLDSPLAPKVYSPDELSKVRLLSAASDVLASPPKGSLDLNLGEAMGHSMRQGAGALLGATLSHGIGIPEVVGGVGGAMLEQPLEAMRGAMQRTGERSGAKPDFGLLRQTAAAGNLLGGIGAVSTAPYEEQQLKSAATPPPPDSPAPGAPIVAAPDADPWAAHIAPDDVPQQAAGGRAGRASGGKVDNARVEELLGKLMARSEQVKRAQKTDTKPLLKVPDEAIARALDAAQKAV